MISLRVVPAPVFHHIDDLDPHLFEDRKARINASLGATMIPNFPSRPLSDFRHRASSIGTPLPLPGWQWTWILPGDASHVDQNQARVGP